MTDAMTRKRFLKLAAGTALGLAGGVPGLAVAGQGMATRPIPASGEALPLVGLGTWQTFDIGGDAAERKTREAVLAQLFASGGSVIDSSPMYGRSESVVGDLLTAMGAQDKAFIATKVWTRGRGQGIAQMENSLRKLGRDRLDLMQVHNLVDWQVHLKTLRDWKAEGRIRYLGITHYTSSALDGLAAVIEREPIDFVQCAYSIGVRAAEERLLPLAAERGVAVLVNRPYVAGSLFRQVKGRALPAWAAEELDCSSWGQFFLKFILGHPAVTCVIPGTAKVKHMADNSRAGFGRLPDEGQRRRMVDYFRSL